MDAPRLDATVIVLAGGSSRRMGCDKALLPAGGRPLLSVMIETLRAWFDEVLISAGCDAPYRAAGAAVVVDERPGFGPSMGILCGLRRAAHERCCVVACDMPNLDRGLLAGLEGRDACVGVDAAGTLQPTLAAYRRSMAGCFDTILAGGHRSVLDALALARTGTVPVRDPRLLCNLNTPDDYSAYLGQGHHRMK